MKMNIADISKISKRIITEVERAIVGKREVLEEMMTVLLANGHILLEDYPGLAKTLIANNFASALGLAFKRIQFTPDLLPGDITGSYVYNRNKGRFDLRKGPIFANIILADEINRASPKTQSALLEAMQEYQVTLEGETLQLPNPFIVIATQNPIEYEGTFPLPEAQLDRFLVKLSIGYPNLDEEQEILRRRRERRKDDFDFKQVATAEELINIRRLVEDIYVDPDIERYIASIVAQTRRDQRTAVGASPRGSLALLKLGRAYAALKGRTYVLPDDIKRFIKPALAHRMVLKPDLWMNKLAAEEILESISNLIPVPVIDHN
ncbi:MAG: MoxR family ATPase [Anaerolineales bacterium]|jgi:MoxR-like ATPase